MWTQDWENEVSGQIMVGYPTNTPTFPLELPVPLVGYNAFSWAAFDGSHGYTAPLDDLHVYGRNDCKDDGWTFAGFRNRGQCVRYFETGKDSR